MIKGAIFDMDGTLLESMGMWYAAGVNYLETLGIEADKSLGDTMFCMTVPIAAEYIYKEFDLGARGLTIEEIIDGINAPVAEFYRNDAQPKPGAGALLKKLHDMGILVIIGTSSSRSFVEMSMSRLGYMDYVTDIISCVDLGHTKAEPLLFDIAAEKMGSAPDETWVFEDGLYALETAVNNGYRTVGLYDEISHDDWEKIQEMADISAVDCAHINLDEIINY